jgi:hypothetical protein
MKFPLLPFLFLISCGSSPDQEDEKEKEKKKTGPEKRIIGRVFSVQNAGEFVLIQKFGTGTLPDGFIYQSQGPDGRTASLRPSGERVRDFYAADLVSGDAKKGDAVLSYVDPPKIEGKSTDLEENLDSKSENPSSDEISPDTIEDGQTPETIKTEG